MVLGEYAQGSIFLTIVERLATIDLATAYLADWRPSGSKIKTLGPASEMLLRLVALRQIIQDEISEGDKSEEKVSRSMYASLGNLARAETYRLYPDAPGFAEFGIVRRRQVAYLLPQPGIAVGPW